ncbi:MAG: bifunctional metallophosphatase/5'-nucleotidase [Calditrichaeota bacterium]|nr:bifunctional metallophosphatase/5'-nucleotidase [Calditrichota bacterium]
MTRTFLFILLFGPLLLARSPQLHRITVFFTNDIHGGIVEKKAEFLNPEFPPVLGGGASAAAIIKKVKAQAREQGFSVITIDAGDIFQGTLVGTLSKGKAVVEYMNRVGYDACVPGNHDFDLGKDNLIELIKASQFAWVSCNIFDTETGTPWKWVKPWIIIERNGLKIGITGATTVGTRYMSFPENIKGLEFRPEIPSLQKAVDQLRENGADLVIALVHLGLPYDPRQGYLQLKQTTLESVLKKHYVNAMEVAHFVKGIDLLLGGHLHRGYAEPWVDPVNHTICIQNYGNMSNLGWINLYVEMTTRTIYTFDYPADASTLLLLQEDEFWPDSVIYRFIKQQQAIYEKGFEEVIGEARTTLTRSSIGESPLNNLITDAMRLQVNADFAFTNFGGIRADLKKGPITRADVFRVLPFGNQIVTFHATGKFIKDILEQKLKGGGRGLAISGGKVIFNRQRPDGQRVVYMEIGGKPLEPKRTYRVATTDYLMEGNSGLTLLKTVPPEEVAYTGILLREAVIEYIRKHSPLHIQTDGRWKRDNHYQPDQDWIRQFEQPKAWMWKMRFLSGDHSESGATGSGLSIIQKIMNQQADWNP